MDKESLFRTAIEANKDRIYRLCCSLVADEHARQDVYQEVLLHVWQSLHRFEGRSQLSTWIFRIAVNTCLAFRRSEQRHRRRFDTQGHEPIGEVPDQATSPGLEDGRVRQLYAGINRLPPMDRALISLYLDDLSAREMAEILGISEGNARVKLHRAKNSLREIVEQSDGSE